MHNNWHSRERCSCVDVGEVLLFTGLGIVALMGRHHILNIGAFVGFLLWGLSVADTYLTTGIAIILVGSYFLWRSYELWFGR